jgi:hypothetical protein
MHRLLLPLLVLAACGFAASLCVHVLALVGIALPTELQWSMFGLLHFGIFMVFLPALLVFRRLKRAGFRQAFAGVPRVALWAMALLVPYVILNFVFRLSAMSDAEGSAGEGLQPAELSLFSGHWLFFYGLTLLLLWAAHARPRLLTKPKCSQGHGVLPTDRFCSLCGEALPECDGGLAVIGGVSIG